MDKDNKTVLSGGSNSGVQGGDAIMPGTTPATGGATKTGDTGQNMQVTPNTDPGSTFQGSVAAPEHKLDTYTAGLTPDFHLENAAKVKTLGSVLGGAIEDKEQMVRFLKFALINSAINQQNNNGETSKDEENETSKKKNLMSRDPYTLSVMLTDLQMGRVLFAIPLSPAKLIEMMTPNMSMFGLTQFSEWWPSVDVYLHFMTTNVRLNLGTVVVKHRVMNKLIRTGAFNDQRGASLKILKTEAGTQRQVIADDSNQTYAYSATLPNRNMTNPYRKMWASMDVATVEFNDGQGEIKTLDEETDWLVCYVNQDMMGTIKLLEASYPVAQIQMSIKINRERTEVRRPATFDILRDNMRKISELMEANTPLKDVGLEENDGTPKIPFIHGDPNARADQKKIDPSKTKFYFSAKDLQSYMNWKVLEIEQEKEAAEAELEENEAFADVHNRVNKKTPAIKFGSYHEIKKNKKTGETMKDIQHVYPEVPTDSLVYDPDHSSTYKTTWGKYHNKPTRKKTYHEDIINLAHTKKGGTMLALVFNTRTFPKLVPLKKLIARGMETEAKNLHVDLTLTLQQGSANIVIVSSQLGNEYGVVSGTSWTWDGRKTMQMYTAVNATGAIPHKTSRTGINSYDNTVDMSVDGDKIYMMIYTTFGFPNSTFTNPTAHLTLSSGLEHILADEVIEVMDAELEYLRSITTDDNSDRQLWSAAGITPDAFTHYYNQFTEAGMDAAACKQFEEDMDGVILTPVEQGTSEEELTFVHGFEGTARSKDEFFILEAIDQDGKEIFELLPSLAGCETFEECTKRVKQINSENPGAVVRTHSILSDPILSVGAKVLSKEEYENKVGDLRTRGIGFELLMAVGSAIFTAVIGSSNGSGNSESIANRVIALNEEEEGAFIPRILQMGKFVKKPKGKTINTSKLMRRNQFEQEWANATNTVATRGRSLKQIDFKIESDISDFARMMSQLLVRQLPNGALLDPRKYKEVTESPIGLEFADLPPDIQTWIDDTYMPAFDTMQTFKTLVLYDLISKETPELFGHEFGPNQATLRAVRDLEYDQMLQTAIFTPNVYQYVLGKYHLLTRARATPGDWVENLRNFIE